MNTIEQGELFPYSDIREYVYDGMICFFKAITFKQKIISWCTGGKFSHVAMTTWMKDSQGIARLMVIESTNGGVRLVNLRSYMGREVLLVNIGLDWDRIAQYAMDKAGVVHYSIPDFIWIGIKDILVKLGLKDLAKYVPNEEGEVCSEFVADLLRNSGFGIEDTLISPQGLYKIIENNSWAQHTLRVLLS